LINTYGMTIQFTTHINMTVSRMFIVNIVGNKTDVFSGIVLITSIKQRAATGMPGRNRL